MLCNLFNNADLDAVNIGRNGELLFNLKSAGEQTVLNRLSRNSVKINH